MADIQRLDNVGLTFLILGGLLTFSFVSYCLVVGLKEIKGRNSIEAKYFNVFGLFFEILIFVGGLYLITVLFRQQFDLLKVGLLTFWQLGLLTLLIVDMKRFRTS
jgi:hypothetical protein